MKKAPIEKQDQHNELLDKKWKNFKRIEADLKKKMDYKDVIQDPTYKEAIADWRATWNTCPNCSSTKTVVDNYNMHWHDGDVVCADCGTFVRMYDAG